MKIIPDFSKKMAVVRELFEETNILAVAETSPKPEDTKLISPLTYLRNLYITKYSSNF
jgi:8-oxo-dGTP pyrophosphatase MutT (NUDIX family)